LGHLTEQVFAQVKTEENPAVGGAAIVGALVTPADDEYALGLGFGGELAEVYGPRRRCCDRAPAS